MSKKKPMGPVMTVIGADPAKKIVILQFSEPIDRMEFTPDQAIATAQALTTRAVIAKGGIIPKLPEGARVTDPRDGREMPEGAPV